MKLTAAVAAVALSTASASAQTTMTFGSTPPSAFVADPIMRVIGGSRDGINVLEAPVECWCAIPVGIHGQRASQGFIGCGGWHKPIEQCLQVETAPRHNKRAFSTLP